MEIIHEAGYIHNDLSMDSIAFGSNQILDLKSKETSYKNIFEDKTVHLLDFSYMTPYVDLKKKKYLKMEKVNCMLNLKNELQTYNRLIS